MKTGLLPSGGFIISTNYRFTRSWIFILLCGFCYGCLADALDSLKTFNADEFNSLLSSLQIDTAIPSPPEPLYADSSVTTLSSLYSLWNSEIFKSCFYGELISTNEFAADAGEINRRASLYVKSFPGVAVDTSSIYTEVMLEKYLTEKYHISPSLHELGLIYRWYVDQTPSIQHPTLNEMMPILKCRAMIASDTAFKLCGEQREKRKNLNKRQSDKTDENRPYNEISLKSDPEQCLVKDPATKTCIVSVGELNGFLLVNPFPRFMHPDTVRSMALVRLLMNYFMASQANEKILESRKDLINGQNREVERRLYLNKYPHLLDTVYDENVLSSTFKKYHDRFFCDRVLKKVELVGSSDSFFIDSLYAFYTKAQADKSAKKNRVVKDFIASLSWSYASSETLPAVMQQAIDTMKLLTIYRIATPWGCFLCRVISTKHKLRVSYSEAYFTLCYLVKEDQTRFKGKPDSVFAKEYYENHASEFTTPDTLAGKAWLVPVIDTCAFTIMDSIHRIECIKRDTMRYRPKMISSSQLPDKIATMFLAHYRRMQNKKTLIGPLSESCGTWYFMANKVTPGGKRLPFAAVKDWILKNSEVQVLPFDSIAATESGARFLRNIIMSGAYAINLYNEIKSISNDDILKLIASRQLKISFANNKKPDDLLFSIAKNRLFETKSHLDEQKAFTWIKSLSIDRILLFSGTASVQKK